MPLAIVRNDITKMEVDAIVNAANASLLGGGGVDGAIHRAAGPKLLKACRRLGGCPTGSAKITKGYDLPCRYVIHTVGPVWQGGHMNEEPLLISCYQTSLALAHKMKCRSVAFPLISAGVYGYPREQAIKIATDTIRDFLLQHDMDVYLVVYDRGSFAISQKLYANIQAFIDDAATDSEDKRQEAVRRAGYPLPGWTETYNAPPSERSVSQASPLLHKKREAQDFLPSASFSDSCNEAAVGLEDYLKQMDEGFRDMLLRKIDEKHMTDAECYKKANIDRKLFNKIKNQAEYRPGKTTVVALGIALCLPIDEMEELLRKAGFSFTHSSKFDLIVEYFITRGNYDLFEINQALFAFDEKLLGSGLS